MNFQSFAEQHGLIIRDLIFDRWVRVPTVDHPSKKNGSYIYDGRNGAIRNWAVHEKPVVFQSKDKYEFDAEEYKRKRDQARREKEAKQYKASNKAGLIMQNAKEAIHPYLAKKGFPTQKGHVWNDLLVLPMREGDKLVGCQLIDKDGTKKFLAGQKTKGVSLVIDNKGVDLLCEGFATALSVRRVMKHLKMRYKIHICFSASNMEEIGKTLKNPIVIADNDPAGLKVAKKIGRYWVSDVEGEDFNDTEMRIGTELLAQSLVGIVKDI